MPPRLTRQNGLRVTSTCRAGSQNPIARPMRIGAPGQMQIGLAGFSISSCPRLATVADPIEMGITHDQQMSVMGLANLPVHVCVLAVPAIVIATRKSNP